MKRILFLTAVFCVLKVNAQNYYISFAGTGSSAIVNTVKVENLNAATSLTLNGSDILHLTFTTRVNPVMNGLSSELKIFPNPMSGNAVLQISPPHPGEAIISVVDMTGKPVVQVQSYLENYPQEFRLSGLKSGFYLIKIQGNSFQSSGKLLCNSIESGIIRIEKISNSQTVDEKKIQNDSKGAQATVDMEYTTGDRLKFKGTFEKYSTVIMDIPASSKTITFNFIPCRDEDNNLYPVVEIGTQVWMAENLKTTILNDGITNIPLVIDNTDWGNLNTPGYCWYNNDEASYKNIYGGIYNWYTINTGNLCPIGWHMPTSGEWTTLTTYLGGESVAGDKLKETGTIHWNPPNINATNESGFTSIPGGNRFYGGGFANVGNAAIFWSSTESSSTYAWYRIMNSLSSVTSGINMKTTGYSVRCLKN